MSSEKSSYTSTRIWTRTVRTLRQVHALTGESIVRILDRLADAELARLRQQACEQPRGDHAQDLEGTAQANSCPGARDGGRTGLLPGAVEHRTGAAYHLVASRAG